MLYTNIKIGENEYKCRLNTKGLIEVEKRLGKNPLGVFMKVTENELPLLSDLLVIFHQSLQPFNHGITFDNVYEIYDAYIDDGHTYVDFISLITQIMVDSGLIANDKKKRTATKN